MSDMQKILDELKAAEGRLADGIKKAQDTADKALEESRREGTIHGQTNAELKAISESNLALQAEIKGLRERVLDAEQKAAAGSASSASELKTAGQCFVESDAYRNMIASRDYKSAPAIIERKTIVNATLNTLQPLVNGDRVPGIITPPMRRMTIRNLLPSIPTTSNLIEYASELVFTNSAGPQGGTDSPSGTTEGAIKPESDITFLLSTAAVITLAHWIGASRQVLSDAAQLAGYIDTRLAYGLSLEEEDEILNSTGANGELNGLVNQATAFTGGATNQTALDTLLKAFLQVSLSEYEASAVVLHPTDWTNICLLKDTQGRYLFSDPHSMEAPRVWGKSVVATQSKTVGTFLVGAFDLGAAIYDREGISIRVSDQHSDFFTRNLVAILCEARLALAVYRPAAFITGNLSYAG
jgi:HK97 family phage major capsid protein